MARLAFISFSTRVAASISKTTLPMWLMYSICSPWLGPPYFWPSCIFVASCHASCKSSMGQFVVMGLFGFLLSGKLTFIGTPAHMFMGAYARGYGEPVGCSNAQRALVVSSF